MQHGRTGEIVTAHTADHEVAISKRAVKGEGVWEESLLLAPAGAFGLLWPRMMTGGENNEVIHIFALTTPTGNGGTVYEGQDGAILYSRSIDGGATWDPEHLILDGLGSADFEQHGGDDYAFGYSKGDNVALLSMMEQEMGLYEIT